MEKSRSFKKGMIRARDAKAGGKKLQTSAVLSYSMIQFITGWKRGALTPFHSSLSQIWQGSQELIVEFVRVVIAASRASSKGVGRYEAIHKYRH